MTKTTESKSLQRAYPPDFTHLIAEIADTAMKAIIQPNPTRYIQGAAVSAALELKRLRCGLTPESRREPALAAAFRCDVVRNRVVRDLATEIVEAYEQLRRAENVVLQSGKTAAHQGLQRGDAHDAGQSRMSPVLVSG